MALVSSIDLKKANGSPLKVNFQFENGLPVKPLINVKREIWIDEDGFYGITVMIPDEINIQSLKFDKISYHETSNKNIKQIWIHFESCYFLISNIQSELLKLMLKKKIFFNFVNTEKIQVFIN